MYILLTYTPRTSDSPTLESVTDAGSSIEYGQTSGGSSPYESTKVIGLVYGLLWQVESYSSVKFYHQLTKFQ